MSALQIGGADAGAVSGGAPSPPTPALPDVDATQMEASDPLSAPFEPLGRTAQAVAAPRSPDNTVAVDSLSSASAETSAQTDFTKFKPRPRFDRSVYLLIALIFLVPYSLTITAFLAFMLWRGQAAADPLEYIRDPMPAPKNGGPRRVQAAHDSPILAQRRTILGKPVKAGDLQLTPTKVELTSDGDLRIFLLAKNISTTNTAFEPMHDSYVLEGKSKTPPYTFLEKHANDQRIYGFYLAYHKDPEAKDAPRGDYVLAPRDSITIVLLTELRYRPLVAAIAKTTNEEFTWRVQMRRGFVKVDRKDVSATTVIGVDFSSSNIEHQKS